MYYTKRNESKLFNIKEAKSDFLRPLPPQTYIDLIFFEKVNLIILQEMFLYNKRLVFLNVFR